MTKAGEVLAAEILAGGPIPFSRFMEVALYHPEHGYYRRTHRDPFGKDGDFFTASQLQPVFGRLIAAEVRELRSTMGQPADFRVVELGAGRGEMEPALAEFGYLAIDVDRGALPASLTGLVLANEFFDALPVDVPGWLVDWDGSGFRWVGDGERHESPVRLLPELLRIAASLSRGYLLAIDYGFTEKERIRFPGGTLMSYRRHRALDDVLRDPGEQDITAHVPFTELERLAAACGLRQVRSETLAQFALRIGARDEFAAVLRADGDAAALRLRLQLKTLLFGMGETFRCILFARAPVGHR